MRLRINKTLLCLGIWIPVAAHAWGFAAHKQINNAAVFTLPPALFKFYKAHITEITEGAVKADIRRYAFADEGCKHYLDADYYEKVIPLDSIPWYWKDAVALFGKDTLTKHGTNPWNLQLMKWKLTKAFEAKDLKQIIRLSADIGHYAADLHVPLHSTKNYNGQLTGQEGIHALWESRLFELFTPDYNYLVGRATYVSSLTELTWERFAESFGALDSVIGFEKLATEKYPDKYALKANERNTSKVYNEVFCQYYHQLLNGMVERRARASIHFIGSFWFTCWVDAGQPDLENLKEEPKTESEERERILIQMFFQKGNIIGRRED